MKAIKDYISFIVMTVKCPRNISVVKNQLNNPKYIQLPLYTADRGSQGISIRQHSEMGLSTPSGCNRGARSMEILRHLPQVTQREAGFPGPLVSWSRRARTTVSSNIPSSLL